MLERKQYAFISETFPAEEVSGPGDVSLNILLVSDAKSKIAVQPAS
jgi:hypothetical protein